MSEAQALDHVFGYTICWDISQREPWGRDRQNTRNIRKGFDTFTALGPWIVTRDELPEPQDTRIHVELNGKHVMTAHTHDMICGVRDHIRFLSSVVTLRAGDLITTGTPAGVAKLAPGDKLKGRIEHVGEMWLAVGVGGLLFRTVHLFFLRNVKTGLVWFTKILTDPFHDIMLYHKAPLALMRGEMIEPRRQHA